MGGRGVLYPYSRRRRCVLFLIFYPLVSLRSSGHRKRDTMLHLIMQSEEVTFPFVKEKVMHFVQTCDSCSSVDLRRKTHVVKYPIVPGEPMAHCQLDCVTYTKDI